MALLHKKSRKEIQPEKTEQSFMDNTIDICNKFITILERDDKLHEKIKPIASELVKLKYKQFINEEVEETFNFDYVDISRFFKVHKFKLIEQELFNLLRIIIKSSIATIEYNLGVFTKIILLLNTLIMEEYEKELLDAGLTKEDIGILKERGINIDDRNFADSINAVLELFNKGQGIGLLAKGIESIKVARPLEELLKITANRSNQILDDPSKLEEILSPFFHSKESISPTYKLTSQIRKNNSLINRLFPVSIEIGGETHHIYDEEVELKLEKLISVEDLKRMGLPKWPEDKAKGETKIEFLTKYYSNLDGFIHSGIITEYHDGNRIFQGGESTKLIELGVIIEKTIYSIIEVRNGIISNQIFEDGNFPRVFIDRLNKFYKNNYESLLTKTNT
jgi:hypothetical protein